MAENIFRHVQISSESVQHSILKAANEVTRPIFYAIIIIILVFLPIYTFQGVEGVMFGLIPLLIARGPGAEIQRPLATVVVSGLFTSTLVTLLVIPLFYRVLKK